MLKENIRNMDFRILHLNDIYLIETDRFCKCDNLEDLLNEGEKIVRIINGIASINVNIKGKIKVIGGIKLNGVIHKTSSRYKQLAYKSKFANITDINNPNLELNSVEKWIYLAEENDAIRKVFRLLNYGFYSFSNAYRIYEIIDKELEGKQKEYFGTTDSEINRFTGGTNLPKYSGDLARHGYIKISRDMKKRPMSLEEVSNFISKLTYDWIHCKVSNIRESTSNSLKSITCNGWVIQIESETNVLETLAKIDTQDFKYYSSNNEHFIKYEKFKEYDNVEDILDIGEEIVSVLNGIGTINLNLKGNIRILGAAKEIEIGKEISLKYRQEDLEVEFIVATTLNDKLRYENSVDKWIQLAQTNEYISKVFRLLNYNLSCINILRIIELMEEDLGSKYITILGTTKKEINRLKKSIDNPEISGDLARHGVYNGETISNPMYLGEAALYTINLIYKWIHYRINSMEKESKQPININ